MARAESVPTELMGIFSSPADTEHFSWHVVYTYSYCQNDFQSDARTEHVENDAGGTRGNERGRGRDEAYHVDDRAREKRSARVHV
jgi:hypothetical protein